MRRLLFLVLWAAVLTAGVTGCGRKDRQRSREQIKKAGHEFTAEGFVKAAAAGDLPLMQAYLQGGMDKNLQDPRGMTALMAAAVTGKLEVMKALLDENAKTEMQNKAGDTALILAATANQPEAVRVLVEANADVRARNKENHTALLKAANARYDGVVDVLLATSRDQLARDGQLDRALLVAAVLDNSKMLTALLDKGASANAKTDKDQTALMFAASLGKQGIVETLLARGADPRLINKDSANASVLALQNGHPEIAKLIDTRMGGAPTVAQATPAPAPSASPALPPADADSVAREKAWMKQNGIEPTALLKKETGQDDDKDGFTNDEELANGTNPDDAASHPPYHAKLRLRKVDGEAFPVVFDSIKPKTGRANVTVREGGEGSGGRQAELGVGDPVPGLPFKVAGVRPKKGYEKDTGRLVDTSELTLVNTETNRKLVLIKGMPANSPDATAVLSCGADGQEITVKQGQSFTLPQDPQTQLEVVDIRPTQIVLRVSGSGQTLTVNKQ